MQTCDFPGCGQRAEYRLVFPRSESGCCNNATHMVCLGYDPTKGLASEVLDSYLGLRTDFSDRAIQLADRRSNGHFNRMGGLADLGSELKSLNARLMFRFYATLTRESLFGKEG